MSGEDFYSKEFRAVLRNRLTGEEKLVDEIASEFVWTEGNYSCDCNRSIFFYELDFDDCYPCLPADFDETKKENVIELVRLIPVDGDSGSKSLDIEAAT